MSVAPISEQSTPIGDQTGAFNTANPAIFLSDIRGLSISPTGFSDVPQWLPSGQSLLRPSDLATTATANTVTDNAEPAIVSSTYLQGLQSSLYRSSDSPTMLSGRTFSAAGNGMLRGDRKGDDNDDDDGDDGDDGDNDGGNDGGSNPLSFLSRIPIIGGLLGMLGLGGGFGGFRGGGCSSGGGGCSGGGGGCSEMMAARNRTSGQPLYSSPGMPFWAFRPGFGGSGGNKIA